MTGLRGTLRGLASLVKVSVFLLLIVLLFWVFMIIPLIAFIGLVVVMLRITRRISARSAQSD